MSLSPRTTSEALAFARGQHASRSRDWTGLCQRFVRTSYGIGPLFGSARAQWLGADPEDKHPGGDINAAPVGSGLCFAGGSRGLGHIELAAHPFPSGAPAAWSNDLVRTGYIDKVHRNAPVTAWGQTYSGYITAVNDVDLRMPQSQHYSAIAVAIERMGVALDTAKLQGDTADVKVLGDEIVRLKKMYDTLRHA